MAGVDAEQTISRAAEVLAANRTSGRFTAAQSYLPSTTGVDGNLLSYAGQILVTLLTESDLIARLTAGDSATWSAAIERLERMAYFWLGPNGRAEWAAWEAREAAAHTCADLWLWLQSNPYPFDVPFDRWTARALSYRLSGATRKRLIRERWFPTSLDQPLGGPTSTITLGDRVADVTLDAWVEQSANREALLQAIDLLDARLAEVLRLWYLEQWSADEIAAQIGVAVGYVYVLRFRGIEKLRKVAAENERLGLISALPLLESEGRRSQPSGNGGEPAKEGVP